MKIKYLTYTQAHAIQSDFQHLVGQPLDFGNADSAPIYGVIIAPYSRILQWSFARQVVKGVPPQEVLKQWTNDRFDVIVISHNPVRPADFQLKDLRGYLKEHGMEFYPMRYKQGAN